MIKITSEKFNIVSKIVKIPQQEIRLKDLAISFNELFYDYVVYFPGSVDKYITYIGDQTLGFGPRYLLKKVLDEVAKANPDGTVDSGSLEVRTIPELPEPIIRRLGSKRKATVEIPTNNKEIGDFGDLPEQCSCSVQTTGKNSENIPPKDTNIKEDPNEVATENRYK